jgi:aspartyl-tRNA(Asn)/glutamyl-tRNA(Gln) amidotransferase subunit A
VTAGFHPRDPGSVPVDTDFRGAVDRSVEGLRVGYSPDLEVFPVDSGIEETVSEAVDALDAAGATVEPVTVDHGLSLDQLTADIETTFSTTFVGVAEVLRQEIGVDLRNHPDEVSDSLLRLLEMGDEKSIPDVAATGIGRTQLFDAVTDVFEEYDLLVTPTTAVSELELHTDRGLDWERALTWPFNWTGNPAAAVPAGEIPDGGLASVQLVGQRYDDETVLAASGAIERERPWDHLYPR